MTITIATLGERALARLGVAVVPVADRPALTAIVAPAVIATNALVELGVIAADETPAPLDQALALSKVAGVHDALVAQAVVSWPLAAIPQAVAEEYTKLAGNVMGSSFGKPGDPQIHAMLEARVRKVALQIEAPDWATQAVLSVHQDLSARGLVRWSYFDIPAAVEDVYTFLGAYQLAPLFGMQPNVNDAKQAEVALARHIALPTSGERVPAEYF